MQESKGSPESSGGVLSSSRQICHRTSPINWPRSASVFQFPSAAERLSWNLVPPVVRNHLLFFSLKVNMWTLILIIWCQQLIFNIYIVSRWSLVLFLDFPGKYSLMSCKRRNTINLFGFFFFSLDKVSFYFLGWICTEFSLLTVFWKS